jgi:hypothetical protein
MNYDEACREFHRLKLQAANTRRELDAARERADGAARVLRLASDAATAKPELLHVRAAAAESFDRAREAVAIAETAHARDGRAVERQVVVMSIVRERSAA